MDVVVDDCENRSVPTCANLVLQRNCTVDGRLLMANTRSGFAAILGATGAGNAQAATAILGDTCAGNAQAATKLYSAHVRDTVYNGIGPTAVIDTAKLGYRGGYAQAATAVLGDTCAGNAQATTRLYLAHGTGFIVD
jgi:hypothetical protein